MQSRILAVKGRQRGLRKLNIGFDASRGGSMLFRYCATSLFAPNLSPLALRLTTDRSAPAPGLHRRYGKAPVCLTAREAGDAM